MKKKLIMMGIISSSMPLNGAQNGVQKNEQLELSRNIEASALLKAKLAKLEIYTTRPEQVTKPEEVLAKVKEKAYETVETQPIPLANSIEKSLKEQAFLPSLIQAMVAEKSELIKQANESRSASSSDAEHKEAADNATLQQKVEDIQKEQALMRFQLDRTIEVVKKMMVPTEPSEDSWKL